MDDISAKAARKFVYIESKILATTVSSKIELHISWSPKE